MKWGGKATTGTMNPGPNAVAITSAVLDITPGKPAPEGRDSTEGTPPIFKVRIEADGIVFEGTPQNPVAGNRRVTGTWTRGAERGTFRFGGFRGHMQQRLPGFKGEYLWELEIPEKQITALAEAIPADKYSWRPSDRARSVSEVLVHIAVGNFFLLDVVGVPLLVELYGRIEGDGYQRMVAIVHKNDGFEKTITVKADVVPLLARSLGAIRAAFTAMSDDELARLGHIFGEQSTARRVYLRMLAHMNEHMGQLTAYARSMGMPAPWPDWRAAAGLEAVEHS
jgi:uncharacterized damage-inducible protein DinB